MDSGPAWIEELLKNNYAPSDEAAQEVKGLLLKPMKDLEDLDAEIKDLKSRLSELEGKRSETQEWISRYESILAPIRRIPPDVLGEIFYECLPTHRHPIMKSSDCPLLLTRVCSPWRTAALSFPRLWERLYITFTDDDTLPDLETAAEMVRNGQILGAEWQNAQSKSEKQRTTEVLWKRYEAVVEWVLRSGTRPLSISIFFSDMDWLNIPHSDRPPGASIRFLSFLATLAPRLKELELKTSSTIHRALERIMAPAEMRRLTSLRVEYHYAHFSADATHPLMMLQAPNLRQLSIAAGDFTVWGISDPLCRWNQLTNISCSVPLTVAETIALLEHSSSVVHFKGIISDYIDNNLPNVSEGSISVPSLQSISIAEHVKPRRLGKFYDLIDAPSLRCVDFSSQFFGTPADFDPNNPARPLSISILPLLRKSTELRKLSVDAKHLTMLDIGTLLEAVPNITHLVIGPQEESFERRIVWSGPYTHTPYDLFGVPKRDLWSFGHLIVPSSSEDNKPPLLPQLTSLMVSSPKITARISDETLSDFIKSRIIPGRSAALERVRIIFDREREKDIVKEIADYGELMGVKINLGLRYNQPPAANSKPSSPEFGLDRETGRSWPYIDAGEDL